MSLTTSLFLLLRILLTHSLRERFPDSELLSAFDMFDPKRWRDCTSRRTVNDQTRAQLSVLLGHFSKPTMHAGLVLAPLVQRAVCLQQWDLLFDYLEHARHQRHARLLQPVGQGA